MDFTIQHCIDFLNGRGRVLTMQFCMEVSDARFGALQAAGVLAILVAIGHGAIAELRVFPRARIEP
jgi:hypothetical protein